LAGSINFAPTFAASLAIPRYFMINLMIRTKADAARSGTADAKT
jgi:hypothetical protein